MPNYQNGKIYMICCNEIDNIYYGSTTQELCVRIAAHRRHKKSYENGKHNYISSFKILKYPSARIVLVELVSCNSREELLMREQYYIRNNNCVNKCIPLQTDKEYRESHKEQIAEGKKKCYEANKEHYLEYQKEYQEENKELIAERSKKYRETHKEQISNVGKVRYEAKKEELKAKSKARYEAKKDEINKKKREARALKKQTNNEV
jgi:hypothetical protein